MTYEKEALEYIAKLADGGCRDSITYLDKCLAFSKDLTLENVVKALGTVDYQCMCDLTEDILTRQYKVCLERIKALYEAGKDLKQFLKQYTQFILDVLELDLGCDWSLINIPKLPENESWVKNLDTEDYIQLQELLKELVKLNTEIKYSSTPRHDIEAALLLFMLG